MQSVQVEIFGRMYSIKGGEDPDHVRSVAAFLDEKMHEVQKGTGTADPHRVAILTALTITDELFRLRDRTGSLETTAETGLERLLDITASASQGD